ncbi:Predicted small secreted protein [Marinobacter daqiaonensis]|uniref:Predicted small secreted protein n=1 Tax=Marinobacter daqiaonensis TaxID=650891 RepID=A0A1I6GK28_9GAMM|nr:entericidin A/B family lipoprotein [Marinobacter daqiaonensis]SFR42499.1 Predicted small secreted protein [Marinobacter daqiaonensis]
MRVTLTDGSIFRSLMVVLLLAAGMAGCNTMEGFGRDVESAGEEIEDQAD